MSLVKLHYTNLNYFDEEKGTLVKGTLAGDSISFSQEYAFYPSWTAFTCATRLDDHRFIVRCHV